MSNKPTQNAASPVIVTKGTLWTGAAAMAMACGTTLAANDNTAMLVRSDLNADGAITWLDLNSFLTAMQSRAAIADLNNDGAVNDADMQVILSNMGKSVTRSTPLDSTGAETGKGAPGAGGPPPAPAAAPAETPTGGMSVSLGNNALDFLQGEYQILRHRGELWRPDRGGANADVSVVEKDGGFDLVFTMTNNGRRAKKLGSVVLDGFRLGQAVKVRDFRAAGMDIALDDPAARPIRDGLSYPSEWYSPVMVLQSEIYTLGVSIQYPILDYKHEVRLSADPTSDGQRIEIELNDKDGPVGYNRDAEIEQHEIRRYVVSVRVLPASEEEWVSVLAPYREYFQDLYGDADYDRDPRPVHAVVMASPEVQGPENRGGFLFEDLRPDVHGFGPWTDELDARADLGWERFMLWRVTGLPSNSRGQNSGCGTFEFASPLEQDGPMRDAFVELPRFDSPGKNLGMWWGDPMRTDNARRADDFDISNPNDIAEAIREAQVAAQAGAETVGLERFNTMPAWDAYGWVNELRAAAPGVEYITQPACGDLIHTVAGAFMIAQPGEDDAPTAALDTRFYLADYLIPGHETWGLIRVDRLTSPDDDGIRDEIFRLAENGYVPVVVPPVDVDRRIVAEETWRDPEW